MRSTTVGPARLRSLSVAACVPALASALALTALGPTSAEAAADDTSVATFAGLQSASSSCTGTSADPTSIALADDITGEGQVTVGCHVVLDLAGHDLSVTNIRINTSRTLTIDDTGVGGTLTADARSTPNTPGIGNSEATVVINGGTVSASGGERAAGIGGGDHQLGGDTEINGGTVTATGGFVAAGIGGGYARGTSTTTVNGGTVTATGGAGGAGIGGGGTHGSGGITFVFGGTVTATGGAAGAGIGGGDRGPGGTTIVSGGTVSATGGQHGAGIGGGLYGQGGTTAVTAGTVTAAAGAGGGAGIGGGQGGNGWDTIIEGGEVTATATDHGSAVGPGHGAPRFGSLLIIGGVLRLPVESAGLIVPDTEGVEVDVWANGVIDGSAGPSPTYGRFFGNGQINNGGRILLPTPNVTGDNVTVSDRHFVVGFDTQGGSGAPDPVTVFADTFERGNRAFPPAPTRSGYVFAGWNTQADGSGVPVTATSVLPGSAEAGVPVAITAHAQWSAIIPQVSGISPATGPRAGGTRVVITGVDFTDVTGVRFGAAGPAEFTVDSNTQITAIAPPSGAAAYRHIRIITERGVSRATREDRFVYTKPSVTEISPSTGSVAGGTEVTITGTGFADATQVVFGKAGPASDFTVTSDTEIVAIAPRSNAAAYRHVRVKTPSGTTRAIDADRFFYTRP